VNICERNGLTLSTLSSFVSRRTSVFGHFDFLQQASVDSIVTFSFENATCVFCTKTNMQITLLELVLLLLMMILLINHPVEMRLDDVGCQCHLGVVNVNVDLADQVVESTHGLCSLG
jgi:hypothetical protein